MTVNTMYPLDLIFLKSNSSCRDVGMGKVSVSWHSDSSLKENSSIGVFHCLPTQRAAPWDWRIALRPSPDAGEGGRDVLPVAVSTADGDAYFLLGSFNKNFQHCVLAGTCERFSFPDAGCIFLFTYSLFTSVFALLLVQEVVLIELAVPIVLQSRTTKLFST